MMFINVILALSLATLSLAAPANEPRQLGGIIPSGGDNPIGGGGTSLLDGIPLLGSILGDANAN